MGSDAIHIHMADGDALKEAEVLLMMLNIQTDECFKFSASIVTNGVLIAPCDRE